MPRHIYPEAIRRPDLPDGPWQVGQLPAPLGDLQEKKIGSSVVDFECPTCSEDHHEAARLAKYAHVAFTPGDHAERTAGAGVPKELVDVVEGTRARLRLGYAGIEVPPPFCTEHLAGWLQALTWRRDWQGLTSAIADAYGDTASQRAVYKWYQNIYQASQDPNHAARLMGPLSTDPKGDAARLYRRLGEVFHAVGQLDNPYARFDDSLRVARQLASVADTLASDVATGQGETIEGGGDDPADGEVDYSGNVWGKLTVEQAPLTRPAKVKPTRKWTSRDEGVIPTAIHRWATDGRIFKQPVHRGEGWVVAVDCSGSMEWRQDDLQALLDQAPATTVALYSGDEDKGVLRIVAKDGRRANERWVQPPCGGGNVVDGPVLDWLAKQKGKRLWVCDGAVTGVGDCGGLMLDREARAKVAKGKIMRVEPYELLAVIEGRIAFKPGYRWDGYY